MSTQQQQRTSRGKIIKKNPKFLLFSIKLIHIPDYIVLIPLQKTPTINIVSLERRNHVDTIDQNILHIGGGSNGDFIIYKNAQSSMNSMEYLFAFVL
jgi:hypothetical protein